MPCQGPSDAEWCAVVQADLDKVTRLFCETCKALVRQGALDILSDEAKNWWELHKDLDRMREAEEAEEEKRNRIRNNALGKLTSEEREALGIRG